MIKKRLIKVLQIILKYLARLTIQKYNPGIVGITGSVGKTSTREAIKKVLSEGRRVRGPAKNFNNELGLPLSILSNATKIEHWWFWIKIIFESLSQLIIKNKQYPEILILEYGVDAPGDMKYLLEIARPQIGILTAMGEMPAHIEFFSGPEAVLREKAKMINQLPATGFAILNADDEQVSETKELTRAHVMYYGFAKSADLKISNFVNYLEKNNIGIGLKLTYGGSFIPVRIKNVLGKAQAYAVGAAASVGIIFGMNLVRISEALANYESPSGRMKIIKGIKKSNIIDDTYNASPLAMKEALETLKTLKAKRNIGVLGDMLELGKYTIPAHEEIGKLSAKVLDILITVGAKAKFIAEAAEDAGMRRKSIIHFQNINNAGMYLQNLIKEGDLILVKGSQSVRMEQIVKEVMAEPQRATELLVRQEPKWLAKPGLYD